MSRKSIIARQAKREKIVERFAEKRAALKAAGDYAGLDALPRNSSPVRLKNRCKVSGRPKGYVRHFGLSRNMVREMAMYGLIPGLKKASW